MQQCYFNEFCEYGQDMPTKLDGVEHNALVNSMRSGVMQHAQPVSKEHLTPLL